MKYKFLVTKKRQNMYIFIKLVLNLQCIVVCMGTNYVLIMFRCYKHIKIIKLRLHCNFL